MSHPPGEVGYPNGPMRQRRPRPKRSRRRGFLSGFKPHRSASSRTLCTVSSLATKMARESPPTAWNRTPVFQARAWGLNNWGVQRCFTNRGTTTTSTPSMSVNGRRQVNLFNTRGVGETTTSIPKRSFAQGSEAIDTTIPTFPTSGHCQSTIPSKPSSMSVDCSIFQDPTVPAFGATPRSSLSGRGLTPKGVRIRAAPDRR
jgi:hypothetical protein